MRRSLFFLFLFPSFLSAQVNLADSIDRVIAENKNFSGVVLVAENGKPVYYKAFGYRDFAKQAPLEKTDLFELASVSKQFTSMIIMMLKEKGKLSYDDPVEKYIHLPYPGITIRNLLNHTSGLPDYLDVMDKYWDKSKVAGNEDNIEYLNKYAPPKLFEPGTKYEYSNTGYMVLASVAEKASGKDFIWLCRHWIFRPLKMKHTDIRTLGEKTRIKNFAPGYIYIKENDHYARADSFPSSNYAIWLGNRKGPGRVSSTAFDLLKWDQALYGDRLVDQSTLQEAFSPAKLTDGSLSNYGFGWILRSDSTLGRIVYHNGDNPGYKTEIIRYLDKRKTIILLNNNAHDQFGEIIKMLAEKVIKNP
ncbi:MAG TPA: serine hydrolase domain-containing protein [Chitinophagaceae bacterium]|nr:serine hydrolase domain-containing protein [Chitinophagaceae bacterium]